MGHHHGHDHAHGISSERRIGTAFFLNLSFTLLEIAGGLWTNSIAVLSDALHDLGDSLALGLTWRFTRLSRRKGDEVFTFGYRRFTLLGALVMSIVLFAGGIFVLFEAVPRIISPQPTNAKGMLLLAGIGILVNGIAALRMHGGSNLSERVVTWHFVEDVLGWVAVLIAGIVMLFRDVPILDPILSILITGYVLWNVGRRLKETLVILLQGIPAEIDLSAIQQAIRQVPGVCDVHHMHVWSQDGEHHVLTAHIVIDDADTYEDVAAVRQQVKELVRRYGIVHATIEVEDRNGPECADDADSCHAC